MRAVVYREYGGPEVLGLEDLEAPVPAANQVLVRVRATTVSTAEMAMRSGKPFFARFVSGLRRPRKPTTPGSELAGEVVSVGAEVTRLRAGDRVVASTGAALGANAELVVLDELGALAAIPAGATYDDAVSICEGGLTALPFLRDAGRIQKNDRVLVNGASGGVGAAAVQLARHFGAHVTAVCGSASHELVRSLGADAVIDYRATDFTAGPETYDIVFDVVGRSSFGRCRPILRKGGRYLRTVPSTSLMGEVLWTRWFGSRRAILMLTGLRKPAEKAQDLGVLMELMAQGHLRPVISRRFGLEEAVSAHRFVESGAKQGSVVLTIQPSASEAA